MMSEIGKHATTMHGFHGNYLRVDVTRGDVERRPLSAEVLRRFLGGSGLGAWLMLEEGGAEAAAFAPEAPLAFTFSPLVGSPLTTSAKFAVVSKSPLTHRLNDSLASSGFAISGKQTGSDAIVIVGRAEEPSILLIDDDGARLEPAGELWGLDCDVAESSLESRYHDAYEFAVIGPAGEKRVRFATLSHRGRHAGRGGSGAVLGAKNLKAIGVRGSHRCQWAHPRQLVQLAREISQRSLGPATVKYRELGTASNLMLFNRLKTLPTRNFQAGSCESADALSPETLSIARTRTRAYCAACTIGCEHIYSLKANTDGEMTEAADDRGVRLEYENIFALGPLCGVTDSDDVLEASKRCDRYGIDTISAGGTIAFAMECVERGWLEAPWLRFGDGAAVLQALDSLVAQDPLGRRLAEGSRAFAHALGPEAEAIAPQVKGLELPGYEPRGLQTMALGFAVGTRGADHNRSSAYEVDFSTHANRRALSLESARLAVESEDRAALMDSLILCKFLRGVFEDFFAEAAAMLRLVTGWEVTSEELQETSQRIVTAKKHFNVRAGWQPAEDTLPDRFLEQPLADDPEALLTRESLQSAIEAYNAHRGWTREGWIPARLLDELGVPKIR